MIAALCCLLFTQVDVDSATATSTGTVLVATADSSQAAKAAADYLADGVGDQEEINAAIAALPKAGGLVQLAEGTYDIRRIEGELGGVLIKRSNVVLAGRGHSTTLRQAANQETNVIRIMGSGVGHITIRDLHVDANRDENPLGEGDPDVSHARFEFCGIKAFCQRPGESGAAPNHNITIQNCHIHDARRLGIMLEGANMRVLDCHIGNANSDAVEILTGPGIIRGNYFEITGRTHVACGSDRGNSIIMSQNIVHVKSTGDIDIGFRSWSNSERHIISNNVLTVDPGGKCGAAMEVRGYGAIVTGNTINKAEKDAPLPLRITGGDTMVHGNFFDNVTVVVDDKAAIAKPIYVFNNIMRDSTIDHVKGDLRTSPDGP